jgi:acetyl-CoA acetyltransferase
MNKITDVACIAGIGETNYVRGTDRSARSLILEAAINACHDAGVETESVDGVIIPYADITNEDFISALGIRDLKFHAHVNIGGASATSGVLMAAGAIAAGLANRIIVSTGWTGYSGLRLGSGSPDLATQQKLPGEEFRKNLEFPYGMLVPMQWYSLHANRWFFETNASREGMEIVALNTRKHAHLNQKAVFKDRTLSSEQYQQSPFIVKPFKLFDICIETDGAAAVLVTRANDRTSHHRPVYIAGGAEGHANYPDDIIGRPDILDMGITHAAPRALNSVGVTLDEIDFAQIYDCFTFIVLRQLEEIGFCQRGEATDFVKNGRIGLNGSLPLNTHGGLLSQAHVLGMNHVVEAVQQLRGNAGEAQVKNAHMGLVTGYGDFGDGSIIILHN